MAPLSNHRQERFVQLVTRGIPPWRAYEQAGYRHHESAPYRLCGSERVKQRMAELTAEMARETKVSVQSITRELDEIAAGAVADRQWSAAKGAVETKARLHGLLIERRETGAPGEFAEAKNEAEVVAAIREQLGDAAAEALVVMIGAKPISSDMHRLATIDDPEQKAQ